MIYKSVKKAHIKLIFKRKDKSNAQVMIREKIYDILNGHKYFLFNYSDVRRDLYSLEASPFGVNRRINNIAAG